MALAPHNPLGPISLAACLQVDAAAPNFFIQEHPVTADGSELGNGLLRIPFVVRDGHIDVPRGSGLGIEVDEEAVRHREYDGNWATPRTSHADGSVAEW